MSHNTKLRRRIKTGAVLGGAALVLSLIAGCGGGGGGSASTNSTAQAATMTGTVAVGSAVANATVTVFGANGASATVTADGSGGYSVSLAGLTAPYVVVATDPSGVNSTLVSVLASVPSGSTRVVTNVTTLTSAVAALMTASGNPLDLATGGNFSANVTADAINSAVSKLNAALSTILAANGVSPANFDPIGTPFSPNQSGIDAVIDDIELVSNSGGGVQLMSVGDTSTGIPLNRGASIGGPLSSPPAHGGYLGSLMTELGQCLAGTTSACSQAIDASYLENGFSSFASAHSSLAASGVKLGVPQTLEFFTSGSTQKALVLLRYISASGVPGSTVTVVQKTGSGWDIVGNQQPFNVMIHSFLAQRTYLDSANAPFNRFESGIEIEVPAGANGTPNPVTLGSVGVTGPGISGTAFLVPRNGSGNSLFALTSTTVSTPPTLPTTTNSNTTLYRWSWQAVPGVSGTFSPAKSSRGFYTPASIDVATVPNFSTYTVTFYDTSGSPIGSPFPVINASPTVPAVAGNGVPWQSLTSDTIANVLTPGASLAAIEPSLPLSWSNLVGGLPVAPVVAKAGVQGVPGTGVTPSTTVEGFSIMPTSFAASGQYATSVVAGVDQNGNQQCESSCAFPALQTGGSRVVQLIWNMSGVGFFNIWKYTD